jgi:hypothetical protein
MVTPLQRFHFRLQSDRTQRGFSSRNAALRCPVLLRVEVKMLYKVKPRVGSQRN